MEGRTFAGDEFAMGIAAKIEPPDMGQLRLAREWLMLSQPELAEALGFKPSNGADIVRRWERGEIHPSPGAWQAFRYLLGLAFAYRCGNSTAERILPVFITQR